jgi:putative ABC transport system permease protein
VLVTLQFGISVALIVSTLVIEGQLRYMQTKQLGFDEEQVLVLPTHGEVGTNQDALKEALLQLSSVQEVTFSSAVPGQPTGISFYSEIEGYERQEGEDLVFQHFWVDYDFVDALGLEVVAGRTFSPGFPTDAESAVLVNEAAARRLNWDEPLGKYLGGKDEADRSYVIGVVGDFHVKSLKEEIEPMVLELLPTQSRAGYVTVKLRTDDYPAALAALEQTWDRFVPTRPFQYDFIDQHFDALYRAEERLGRLFSAFAALAILIACLGLFGLSAFTAEQRTKELGVRKVLGASVPSLVVLLSKDFLVLVALGFVLAAPLAYLALRQWLDGFAYRLTPGWGVFALAAALAVGVALATISYQAIRAALANPVDSLRYE